jgi:hypothetical protein
MNLGCGISLTNSVTCNPEGTTPETKWPGFGSISPSCGSVTFPVSIITPPTMEAPGYATFDWDTSGCNEIIEECCKCSCNAPETCCGPKGEETCCAGTCIDEKCCDPADVCGGKCCAAGQQCVNGQCCDAGNVCAGQCCGAGQQCVNGQCCDAANVCGNSCGCPAGQQCIGGECLAPPTTTTTTKPECPPCNADNCEICDEETGQCMNTCAADGMCCDGMGECSFGGTCCDPPCGPCNSCVDGSCVPDPSAQPADCQCVNGECKDCVICDPGATPPPDGVCCYPPKTAPFQILSRGDSYDDLIP